MEPIAREDEVAGDPQAEAAAIAGEGEEGGGLDSVAVAAPIAGGDDASAMAVAEVEEAPIAEGDEKDGEIDAPAAATQISGGDEKGGEFDASAMAAAEVEEALIAVTDRDKKGKGRKTNAGALMGAAPPPHLPLLPRPPPSYKDVVKMLRLISATSPTVGSGKSIIPSLGDKESLLEFATKHPSCEVIIKEHIKKLGKTYRFFRPTNLVGGSLFRCFMIAYLEYILMTGDSQEAYHMLLCIETCKYRHMNLGGSKFEFDDFAREFSRLLTCVSRKEKYISQKELVEKCRNECFSRSIIVFLKLVACAVACEMWAAAPGYQNAAEFCLNEIVPTYCEGIESKIINLVGEALRVPIRVFKLTNTRLLRQVPQDYLPPNVGPPRPFLTFLVRTGRCEVLYS